jgi:hypothetical protein
MLDCRTCGACCGPPADYEHYVDLIDVDVKRLSPGFRRHAVHELRLPPALAALDEPPHLSLKTKRNENGVVCVALRGRVGSGYRARSTNDGRRSAVVSDAAATPVCTHGVKLDSTRRLTKWDPISRTNL